jgi:carbon storage regulator
MEGRDMLVLTRQVDEDICIGSDVRVRVLSVRGNQVRLGIQAPRNVSVHRAELVDVVEQENRAASSPDAGMLQGLKASLGRKR